MYLDVLLPYKKLKAWMWRADPGGLRLKQAFRTLCAILLSLILTASLPFLTRVFAAFAAGFCIQGIQGNTLRRRLYHVAILGGGYVLVFTLGIFCNHNILVASFLLAMLAFGVFYLQSYSETLSFPPMMLWTCCYLATILPLPAFHECLINMPGLLIGYLCAMLVALLIFPKPIETLFYENDDSFLKLANQCLQYCDPRTAFTLTTKGFDERFYQYKYRLLALLEVSQSMLDTPGANSFTERHSSVLMCQYGLIKSLSMLHEAYAHMREHQGTLPTESHKALSRLIKKFRLSLVKNIRGHESKPQLLQQALSTFNQHLFSLDISDPYLLTAMMNIKVAMGVLSTTLIGLSQRHVSLS